MAFDVIVTLLLVLLNGFFVAAEFAIVKVRSSQIALEKGNLAKRAAENIIENLDGYLAATQLGITLASLGLGWVGEDVMSRIILSFMSSLGLPISDSLAHNIALPLAFAVLTVLHIVFGELAPKSLAIRYPTSTSLKVSVPLKVFYMVFKPFIWLLNGFANIILKIFGVKPINEQEIHSEEELRLIIAESEEGGAIESAERELIQNVFDFDDRIVRQVMVPRVKISGLKADLTIQETMDLILKEGYSRYPVFENSLDEITGIVHAKDVITAYFQRTGKGLKDVMRPAHFIPESKPIDALLREFQRRKTQMAIVVSEFGGTIGIVTLEDILEELVGEIQDEHDHEQQIVTLLDKQIYHVVAQSSIHDINKFIEVPFPESEDYETLSGMITYYKPSIKEGDTFSLSGYKFKIIKLNKTLPEIVEIKLETETPTD
ncbi:hemolysin family protein [Chryseolinea sp. H1M3-3]|uniref:hemolysin family protein n=1 Tax=Chryseolinea sp. H1M3-3 TaxID=3034144 RepID=UPI0023EB4A67|nr:hemolysin family protein [Chryseolinea sp. H1M3-3]